MTLQVPCQDKKPNFIDVIFNFMVDSSIMRNFWDIFTSAKKEKKIQSATLSKTGRGATVVNMSGCPDDFSTAVNHIVARVQSALAADQKTVILLGEEHGTIADVRMAELVRRGLQKAGIEKPVIALEQQNNLLESLVSDMISSHEMPLSSSDHKIMIALEWLKTADPKRYRDMQALAYVSNSWPLVPVTRTNNVATWHDHELDVRLIDLAKKSGSIISYDDPPTRAFIDANISPDDAERKNNDSLSVYNYYLRDLWMADQLRLILAEPQNRVVLVQTGDDHIIDNSAAHNSQHKSLSSILADSVGKDTKVIAVFPENHGCNYERVTPCEASKTLNSPECVILRGGNDTRHLRLDFDGSYEEEISVLNKISDLSGSGIRTKNDYYNLQNEFKRKLIKEIETTVERFAASSSEPVLTASAPQTLHN